MQNSVHQPFAEFCIALQVIQRRLRDSNPRYPLEVYTLSRRAPSTTRTSLHYIFTATIHTFSRSIGTPSTTRTSLHYIFTATIHAFSRSIGTPSTTRTSLHYIFTATIHT